MSVGRAIQAALAPLMGSVASGQLLVHSEAGAGTVNLPFGSYAIPVVAGGMVEEATAFVTRNPAREDGAWPVVEAGTLVPVQSLQGGLVGNTDPGTEYTWDLPVMGIELVSVSEAGLSGGEAIGTAERPAFGALQQLVTYKKFDQGTFEQFLRAQLSQYPGAVLAWESTSPLDGPMAAQGVPRLARMGTGKFLFRHVWQLFLVSGRLDTEGQRRREGDKLRDDVLETLIDTASARGLRLANEPGCEIISSSVFGVTPTSYIDLVRFGTQVTMKHRRQNTVYNDWLRTRLKNLTAAQGASPAIALPDVTDPMPPSPATMWVSDNSYIAFGGTGACNITGYLEGFPVRNLNFDSISQVDIGHGMCVLSDGALVLAHAEISGGNGNEGFLLVPAASTSNSQVFTSPPIRRIQCNSFTNPAAQAGARVCAELPDGSILLGRGDWFVRLTRAQLEGIAAHAGAAVFRPSAAGLAWDVQPDANGNVWLAGGDELRLLPAAQFPPVGVDSAVTTVIAESKRLKGTNVAPPSYQIYGMALDASGGIWAPTSHDTGAGGDDLRYWDGAAIAALTGVATNPAPTRILTSAAFNNIVTMNIDATGGAWVADFGANKLHYFSAAQLAAGGAQVPQQSITTVKPKPAFIRFARGYGQFDR